MLRISLDLSGASYSYHSQLCMSMKLGSSSSLSSVKYVDTGVLISESFSLRGTTVYTIASRQAISVVLTNCVGLEGISLNCHKYMGTYIQ